MKKLFNQKLLKNTTTIIHFLIFLTQILLLMYQLSNLKVKKKYCKKELFRIIYII